MSIFNKNWDMGAWAPWAPFAYATDRVSECFIKSAN